MNSTHLLVHILIFSNSQIYLCKWFERNCKNIWLYNILTSLYNSIHTTMYLYVLLGILIHTVLRKSFKQIEQKGAEWAKRGVVDFMIRVCSLTNYGYVYLVIKHTKYQLLRLFSNSCASIWRGMTNRIRGYQAHLTSRAR